MLSDILHNYFNVSFLSAKNDNNYISSIEMIMIKEYIWLIFKLCLAIEFISSIICTMLYAPTIFYYIDVS